MTLLLSQLSLNLNHRQVRRDLGNAYDLHRTLSRAFVDGPEAVVKPFLWRLESGRPMEPPRILVQSGAEPIWNQLPEGYVTSLADRAWRPEAVFLAGRAVKLRVLANPTVCRVPTPTKDNPVPEGPARGKRKRLGLWREDEQLEWLLRQAQRLGLSEDTLVVYTTDHGEMCFDHGMVQKQNFFEESARVPLLFRLPDGAGAGAVRSEPVELLDLFPTFCELAGVADSLAKANTEWAYLAEKVPKESETAEA